MLFRSFELVKPLRPSLRLRPPHLSWRDVTLDAASRTIFLPEGAGIDFGGIGKGWAVDRLGAMLGSPGLVNGGGDIYAAGSPADAPAWLVGVEDPFASGRDLDVLAVSDRGVATSSRLKRRWLGDGRWLHHLIDPRTGAPSRSDVAQATVIAPSALLADYHAKVALLLGAGAGLSYLNREPNLEGLVVRSDGVLLRSAGLGKYIWD